MKKNIIVAILLILSIICIIFGCKSKFFKKDITPQDLQQNTEEQILDDNIKETESDKTEEDLETKGTTETQTKKAIQVKKGIKTKVKNEKKVTKEEKNIVKEPEFENDYKKTRSDIVNVENEYIPSKNKGQIYYRGVFYNIKIRQVLENATQNEGEPEVTTTVSETKTIIESQPVVPKLQQAKFEKNVSNTEPIKTDEAIQNSNEVILDTQEK